MPRLIAILAVVGGLLLAGCAVTSPPEAACAGPSLEAKPRQVAPGRSFRVHGEGFYVGCNDTGQHRRMPPDRDIRLAFQQGEQTWELSTTIADRLYNFGLNLEVPDDARPGPAVVSASGANGRTEARLMIQEPGKRARPSGQDHGTNVSGDHPVPEPPVATLSFGDRTVAGSLGSYCWSYVCADTAFPVDESGALIPPDTTTLMVPEGSEMVFDFGSKRPSPVSATAYPLRPSSDERQRMLRLRVESVNGQTRVSGDLPPGAYLVDVLVRVRNGDASYSYNVSVEPKGSPHRSTRPGGQI